MKNVAKTAFWASSIYLALGLLGGFFYRELTRGTEFAGQGTSQLSLVHTHLLTLGFLVMLLVVVLEKTIGLSGALFKWFFGIYNAGVVVTAAMFVVNGMRTISGAGSSPAISGIAGIGHFLLTIGLMILMVIVGKRVGAEPLGHERSVSGSSEQQLNGAESTGRVAVENLSYRSH